MQMELKRILDRLLPQAEKPARYTGGELHQAVKDPASCHTRFGFAFPDTYEIGMSYLGLQIIYHVLNKEEGVYCERLFAPAADMEDLMRAENVPLFTLETQTPAKEMDIVGFTLQYEMSFTNIINMLDLAGIPLRSKDRTAEHPFIAGGGPCAFNPEPLAPIMDFFMIGDGEEVLPEVCRVHKEWKESGEDREAFLKRLCAVEGVYVPKYYEPVYDEAGKIVEIKKLWEGAPDRVQKRIVTDLEAADFPTEPLVPFIQVVHDRAVTEIFRGCTRGCRFCQAGMIYRPVRERTKGNVLELAKAQLANTGHEEISLLSLSTSDHSKVEDLVTELMELCREKKVAMSLPSLRLDSFSFKVLEEIQGYRKTGLTFAPEAGTQRLRDVINKNITEEDILSAMEQAMSLGWNSIKLYFMAGLPTETFEDLDGIADLARKLIWTWRNLPAENKIGRPQITVSLSNFVPKAHTPFQWMPQDTQENLTEKHAYLKEKLKGLKAVHFQYHDTHTSYIEGVLARGDRRLAETIIRAWELGSKFDGWREKFRYENWVQALEDTGLEGDFYAGRSFTDEDILPWAMIDSGLSDAFLKRERDLALEEKTTSDCRKQCHACGISQRAKCFAGREA